MAYYSTPLRKITNIITVIILLEKKKILLAQQDFTMYTYVKVINVQFVQKDLQPKPQVLPFPSPYAIAAIATAPAMLLTYSQTYLGESLPYFSTIFSIALPTIAPSLAFAIL